MPTLTIDLSEAESRAVIRLPANEQRRVLSLAANRYATARNKATQDDPAPTEEDLLAIGEGLAALDAGRTVSSDEFFARLEEKHGWTL